MFRPVLLLTRLAAVVSVQAASAREVRFQAAHHAVRFGLQRLAHVEGTVEGAVMLRGRRGSDVKRRSGRKKDG